MNGGTPSSRDIMSKLLIGMTVIMSVIPTTSLFLPRHAQADLYVRVSSDNTTLRYDEQLGYFVTLVSSQMC